MPLRLLIYAANIYRHITKHKDIYGRKLIKLPAPHFLVFYNGTLEYPEKQILRLSDAFENNNKPIELDLTCTVINISPGMNEDLKQQVPAIYGYSKYVAKVRQYSRHMDTKAAINKAINECINEGVLTDFFRENKDMIVSGDAVDFTIERRMMLVARDSREEGISIGMKAGRKEGIKAGRKEGIKAGRDGLIINALKSGSSPELISQVMGISLDEVIDVQKEMKN